MKVNDLHGSPWSHFDHLEPVEAVLHAWMVPGPGEDSQEWLRQARADVRELMPLLARALDRLNEQQGHFPDPDRASERQRGPGPDWQDLQGGWPS